MSCDLSALCALGSGHYLYEHLASGRGVLENWFLLGDDIRNHLSLSAQCLPRHSNTVYGGFLANFRTVYVKVDSSPEVGCPRALQSRVYCTRWCFHRCRQPRKSRQPVVLCAPVVRGTCMYQNKQVVAQQAAPIERSVHVLGDGQTRFFFFGTPRSCETCLFRLVAGTSHEYSVAQRSS